MNIIHILVIIFIIFFIYNWTKFEPFDNINNFGINSRNDYVAQIDTRPFSTITNE